MDLELNGKCALVTGGSRGIGKAIARQLALEGADVALAARDRARLDAAADELSKLSGRRVMGFVVDTGDTASVEALVQEVMAAFGRIDILVNAAAQPAGHTAPPTYDEVTNEDFFDDMNIKVMGYLRCAQQVAPHMIRQGWGRIINIAGLGARTASSVVGSMRNVAVSAMTKNLADALGPYGINVVVLHPGTTVTEASTPEMLARAAPNVIGRPVVADEVAYVAAFLASPKSLAITGDAVVAGGGSPKAIYY